MVFLTAVAFSEPKAGNTAAEWEDFACLDERSGHAQARFIVGDGATEAYDSQRWGQHIIEAFDAHVPVDGSFFDEASLRKVFAEAQRQWADSAPQEFANVFEERKFHAEGSFATVLCLQIHRMDSDQPHWSAAALGDTVLFHIRDNRRARHFPPMTVAEFGTTPSGVSTRPDELDHMCDQLEYDSGTLLAGDRLYVATDAMAAWLLVRSEIDGADLWARLGALDSPAVFANLIAAHRGSGELHNDDVTLLRIEVADHPPDTVVISQ